MYWDRPMHACNPKKPGKVQVPWKAGRSAPSQVVMVIVPLGCLSIAAAAGSGTLIVGPPREGSSALLRAAAASVTPEAHEGRGCPRCAFVGVSACVSFWE